ncbi:MAG: YaaC family protein [Planctomycetota bacterium]
MTGNHEATNTHIPLDEEYWLALRHPAEVEAVGRELLAAGDPLFLGRKEHEQNQLWRELRSYIRQAEGFYRGASVLPWKSSPLNFYYSIMNLAKAITVAKGGLNPQAVEEPRRLHHGLAARVVAGKPDEWRLSVGTEDGVFSRLYQASVGMPVPDHAVIDGRQLLGYLGDITWQLDKSGNSDFKAWFPCKWVIAVGTGEYWDVVAVPRRVPVDRLPPSLGDAYDELAVDAVKEFAAVTLGLHAIQAGHYRFLQRKVPIKTDPSGNLNGAALDRLLRESMPNCVFDCPTAVEHHFAIGLPYASNTGPLPMNELVAAYAVMYFLSSLVRYHPAYLDKIGETPDAWLIESFAKSAPLTLLRHLTSLVLGYSLVIESA